MHKFAQTVIIRGLVVTTAMVGVLLSTQPLLAQSQAKITAIVLNVTHRVGPEGKFLKSKVGTELGPGSRVRTGPRSKCEIKFPNDTVMRMAPRSNLVITSVTERKVRLLSGQVLANVVKGSGAQIEGAVATAAVRGTTMLFQGATEPGGLEELSVWDGEAQFSTPLGSTTVGHQQTAGAGPSGELLPLSGSFPFNFPTGTPTPWWSGIEPGTTTQSTPGTTVGTAFKEEKVSSGQLGAATEALVAPITGKLDVIVEGVMPGASAGANRSGAAGLMLLAAVPGAFGSSLNPQPGTVFGRAFYGPRTQVDLFGLLYTGGSFAGLRTRASGIWGSSLYLELGGQSTTDFKGDWHTALSEGFGVWRAGQTDFIGGRQHYLEGPVNNSTLGSLFSYTTFDGARLHHKVGNLTVDLAWVDSYQRDIIEPGKGSGALTRVSMSLLGGQAGVTYFHENAVGTGVSADLTYPLVPGHVDLYAELGDDPWDQHLETWGTYFPNLYQTLGPDLFIEHAQRSGYDSLWSATAYQEMRHGWTGVFSARHIDGGDWEGAVGAFKRFGSLD